MQTTVNWNFTFTESMLDGNVYCYGRSGSGKTRCVGNAFAIRAIRQRVPCAIYSPNLIVNYREVINEAKKADYRVVHYDFRPGAVQKLAAGAEPFSEKAIAEYALSPTLVLISNNWLAERDKDNCSLIQFAEWAKVNALLLNWRECNAGGTQLRARVVLDEAGMAPFCGVDSENLRVCYICQNNLMDIANRKDLVKEFYENVQFRFDADFIKEFSERIRQYRADDIWRGYFSEVHTLVCTGLDPRQKNTNYQFLRDIFPPDIGEVFPQCARIDPDLIPLDARIPFVLQRTLRN